MLEGMILEYDAMEGGRKIKVEGKIMSVFATEYTRDGRWKGNHVGILLWEKEIK